MFPADYEAMKEEDGRPRGLHRVHGRGCLFVVIASVALIAVAINGLSNFKWMGRGDAGFPHVSVTRTLDAHVGLDAAHPTAVQALSIEARGGPLPASVDGFAIAIPTRGIARVTVLADDGGPARTLYGSGDESSVNFLEGNDSGDVPLRKYLALVELLNATSTTSVDVHLQVSLDASFASWTTPGPDPSRLTVRLDADGSFAQRSIQTVSTTYRETISTPAAALRRELVLTLTGPALPVGMGGSAHVILTARPEAIAVPAAHVAAVSGRLTPDFGPFTWNLAGSGAGGSSTDAIGIDPTLGCVPNADGCRIPVVLQMDPVECANVDPSSTGIPQPGVCSFAVEFEVRAIFIDAPVVPDGATVTLEPAAPAPTSAPSLTATQTSP
jgi:hypothetical protein